MVSEARIALASLALLGCGGVHDRLVGSEPLLIIRGHVDRAALERPNPGAPLLGALVWAALPVVNPVCLAFDRPELAGGCPDPYGVFPRQVQLAAPVADDGSFALELHTLPNASNSVGNEVTRITYGALVVLEDVNRDGAATLPIGRGGMKIDPRRAPILDVIVAATFHSLRAEQTRLVFREGGFVADSHFYPAPGCPVPPPGFSILAAPPYPVAAGCTTRAVDAPVEVPPLPVAQGQSFACRGWSPISFIDALPSRDPSYVIHRAQAGGPMPPLTQPICLSREILASVVPDVCPLLVVFALKGCANDPLCPQPEWDDTANPPSWWSCR